MQSIGYGRRYMIWHPNIGFTEAQRFKLRVMEEVDKQKEEDDTWRESTMLKKTLLL